jgi:hypothetical protein
MVRVIIRKDRQVIDDTLDRQQFDGLYVLVGNRHRHHHGDQRILR